MKVIITVTTGMVGEGVLLECLQNSQVLEVLGISRKSSGIKSPKLKELLVADFLDIANYKENLKGFDACFFCVGKSSVGMTEADYLKLTYDTTIVFARELKLLNPTITFIFVSGRSTDNTENGKVMWAIVKGKTENELTKIFGNKAFHFRPALMKPTKGQQHLNKANRITHKILYPILSLIFPSSTVQDIGKAMINIAKNGFSKNILEVKNINEAARL